MNKMKKATGKIKGALFIEHFNHFQCGSCKGWWGIGDAPKRALWHCPWCGVKQAFIDKTPRTGWRQRAIIGLQT
jgi:hypothetical protein